MAKRIRRQRHVQREKHPEYFEGALRYAEQDLLLVSCRALTATEALQVATETAAEILGLIELVYGYQWQARSGSLSQALSIISVEPQITSHRPSGGLAAEGFWHYGWSAHETKNHFSPKVEEKAKRLLGSLEGLMDRSCWRDDCRRAVRLYHELSSETGVVPSFLIAWQLLEFMLSEGKVTHDKLIERASAFHQDTEAERVRGRYFLEVRNLLAHGRGSAQFDSLDLRFQIRSYLRPILLAFIVNPYRLKKREEFVKFAVLASNHTGLSEKMEEGRRFVAIADAARKFRSSADRHSVRST